MSKLEIHFDECTFKGKLVYFDGNEQKPITMKDAIILIGVILNKLKKNEKEQAQQKN